MAYRAENKMLPMMEVHRTLIPKNGAEKGGVISINVISENVNHVKESGV